MKHTEYDIVTTRLDDHRDEADIAGRVSRLRDDRRWARRAEYASRRAARASAAVRRGRTLPPPTQSPRS